MSPQRLALRSLVACRARSVLAVLLIGATLCVLDLFAGQLESSRAVLEQQQVVEERLGHLSVLRTVQGPGGKRPHFSPDEAARALRIVQANRGVALALPQMSVSGIASTAVRSTVFQGEGILPAPTGSRDLPGKLAAAGANTLALSRRQADALDVRPGDLLTVAGASSRAPSIALQAQVVETTPGEHLLMPLEMARALHATEGVERLVVYLHSPDELDRRRAELGSALRMAGIPVDVRTWQEQSARWGYERKSSIVAFDSIAGMVFAVVAATIAASMSISVLERKRELATLRALGMRSSSVFLMLLAEALGMALAAVVLSAVTSGLLAWGLNRAALAGAESLAVELDGERMLMAIVAVLAVTLLAALVPAFKAARAPIAPALVT